MATVPLVICGAAHLLTGTNYCEHPEMQDFRHPNSSVCLAHCYVYVRGPKRSAFCCRELAIHLFSTFPAVKLVITQEVDTKVQLHNF